MDFSSNGVTYAMLLIPSLFAFTVIVQGIVKLTKSESDGGIAIGVGFFLLVLIAGCYWFIIR